MDKILFIGAGSEADPGFEHVYLDGKPYREYMRDRGITVLDRVIESCHGCPELMTKYSMQMQKLVDNGDRVVAVLEGGKYFALPGMQATQVTYPIISCPLDPVAYQGIFLPTGHSVIAGVGVERKKEYLSIEESEKTLPKAKALNIAEKILSMEAGKVGIIKDVSGGELSKKLEEFGIESEWARERQYPLVLAYGIDNLDKISPGNILIRADSDENLKDLSYTKKAEERHHLPEFHVVPTAQVSGLENLAIFAAKIMSLQRPDIREMIKEIGENKRRKYEERDLDVEVYVRTLIKD